jgi:hypothetical protein
MPDAIGGMGRLVLLPGTSPVKTHTRPAVPADIPAVAKYMRAADVAEVKAGSGSTPEEVLLYSFMMGRPCETWVAYDGEPVAMWGVVPDGRYPEAGRVWLLGTDRMVTEGAVRMRLLRQAKQEVERVGRLYDVLWNYVDARNQVHINWLRWMGFTFIAERPNYGAEGRLFLEFCKVSHV